MLPLNQNTHNSFIRWPEFSKCVQPVCVCVCVLYVCGVCKGGESCTREMQGLWGTPIHFISATAAGCTAYPQTLSFTAAVCTDGAQTKTTSPA